MLVDISGEGGCQAEGGVFLRLVGPWRSLGWPWRRTFGWCKGSSGKPWWKTQEEIAGFGSGCVQQGWRTADPDWGYSQAVERRLWETSEPNQHTPLAEAGEFEDSVEPSPILYPWVVTKLLSGMRMLKRCWRLSTLLGCLGQLTSSRHPEWARSRDAAPLCQKEAVEVVRASDLGHYLLEVFWERRTGGRPRFIKFTACCAVAPALLCVQWRSLYWWLESSTLRGRPTLLLQVFSWDMSTIRNIITLIL